MDGCELRDHWRRHDFRAIDPLFAIFTNLVTRIHEEACCSRQPIYLSNTLLKG